MYLWFDNAWHKITSINSDGNAVLDTAATTTNTERVHVGKMNEIQIQGENLVISELSYSYTPRAI